MPSEAFLIQDGKEFGPFTPSQLKQLADAGRIRPDDLIKKGQDGQPIAARRIAGLLDAFGAASPKPTPQKSVKPADAAWIGEVLAPDDKAVPSAPVPKKAPPRIGKPIAAPQAKPSWLTTERVPPNFDPYHVWLGIPKGKRPPTHYHLLRIASNEHADEVIEAAAERQGEYVRKCRIGEYAPLADRLLYEIEEARLCLLNPPLRREYDEKLAEDKQKPVKKRVLPPPGRPVGEGNEIATTYFKIVSILTAAFILTAVVSFVLPWKKVVFSKSSEEPEAANIGAAPFQPAVLPMGNAANGPLRVNQPGVRAAKNPPPPIKDPSPPLLVAPFNVTAANDAQKIWAAHLAMPVDLTNSIGMKLILIPPGEFMMGSDDPRFDDDVRPAHRVRLTKPMYFGVYEVTQEEFERIMGFNPSHFHDGARLPVESVTGDNIRDFLRKLAESPEEKRAGRHYRLPTEAEWEYACQAGSTTLYCYGDALSVKQANFAGEKSGDDKRQAAGLGRTTTVGSYAANAFGLYDMHGNVIEAVSDFYSPKYYAASPINDPKGPDSGQFGVGRGGSWKAHLVWSARRFPGPRNYSSDVVGFRVVCDASLAPAKDGAVKNDVGVKTEATETGDQRTADAAESVPKPRVPVPVLTKPEEQSQPRVVFRSFEIAIDEKGGCELTVDSRKAASDHSDDNGDVIEAGSDDKPEIVRLRNGNRRIDYDFARLRSVEALIPQKLPDKSLQARMRGQLAIDKDAGAVGLSPVRANGRVAFDLALPMNTQFPFKIKIELARFDQGRFNVPIMMSGNCFCVALDQRYQGDAVGVVHVDWRQSRGGNNSPVYLEQPQGWQSLLKYVQEEDKVTKRQFHIPPASLRKMGRQRPGMIFFGILGDRPVLIRRVQLTGASFKEAFSDSK